MFNDHETASIVVWAFNVARWTLNQHNRISEKLGFLSLEIIVNPVLPGNYQLNLKEGGFCLKAVFVGFDTTDSVVVYLIVNRSQSGAFKPLYFVSIALIEGKDIIHLSHFEETVK